MSSTGQGKGPLKRFRKKENQDWRLKDSTPVKLTLVQKMIVEMTRAQNILKDTNENRFLSNHCRSILPPDGNFFFQWNLLSQRMTARSTSDFKKVTAFRCPVWLITVAQHPPSHGGFKLAPPRVTPPHGAGQEWKPPTRARYGFLQATTMRFTSAPLKI